MHIAPTVPAMTSATGMGVRTMGVPFAECTEPRGVHQCSDGSTIVVNWFAWSRSPSRYRPLWMQQPRQIVLL